MKISKKYLVIIGIVGITLSISIFYFHVSSVKYSLNKVYQAVLKRDSETFMEYFNSEAVIEDLHTQFLNDLDDNIETKDEFEEFEKNIGLGFRYLLKDRMTAQFETEILKAIEAGNINSGGSYFSNIVSPDNFKKIAKIEKKGKIADATIEFYSNKYETTFELIVRLRKKGTRWEIIRMPNVAKLIRKAIQEEKIILEKINTPIIKAMHDALKVTNVTFKIKTDLFELERKLYLTLNMSNNPEYPKIRKFDFDMVFYNLDNSELKTVNVTGEFDNESDEQSSYKIITSADLNIFTENDNYIYDNIEEVKTRYVVKSIEFFNGEELRTYDYLE